MDALNTLLGRLRPSAQMSFNGTVCGMLNDQHDNGFGHLHVLRSGRLIVKSSKGQAATLDEPGMVLLPRPMSHTLAAPPDHDAMLICATVQFGRDPRSPLALALPAVMAVPFTRLPSLKPALELLFAEFDATGSGRQAALDCLLHFVLIRLLRALIESGSVASGLLAGLADSRLSRSLNAMHELPQRQWSLKDLAHEASMSRSQFAERFGQVLGVTPLAYLSDWRLSLAQEMLLQGRSAKVAATEVGYINAAAFSRAFARRFGKSPTQWMTEQRRAPAQVAPKVLQRLT